MKLSCVVMLVVAGCGEDPIAISDLSEQVAQARCNVLVGCGETPDLATCMADSQIDTAIDKTIIVDVDGGYIKFDGDLARACLDSIDTSCKFGGLHADQDDDEDPCKLYLQGQIPQGSACFIDQECVGGATCQPTNASCDRDTTCCAGTCGAPIVQVSKGDTCQSDAQCRYDAYCHLGTCTLQVQEGGRCDTTSACANPLICTHLNNAPMGVCYRPGESQGTCDVTFPDPDLRCADEREYCNAANLCVARKGDGANCGSSTECLPGASCVEVVCKDNVGLGEACNAATPACAAPLTCVGGKCAAVPSGPACR